MRPGAFRGRPDFVQSPFIHVKVLLLILERAREMASTSEAILAVGDAQLDLAAGELRRNGVVVEVEPQVFALIAHLAARPGALVSRDELIVAVWGGRIVSDSAIATRINAARAALGDDGKAQRVIQTLPRRASGSSARTIPLRSCRCPTSPRSRSCPSTTCPAIRTGVLFRRHHRRHDHRPVAGTTTVRHRPQFELRLQGRTIDVREVARELGVRYVLEGCVRRAASRVRMTAS